MAGRVPFRESKMTRYFGVRCPTCNADVPLAECKPMEGTKVTFYVVPAEPVSCRTCGSSHIIAQWTLHTSTARMD